MSRYAIVKQVDNDNQDGSLVLAAFGPFVVVDLSLYNNEQSEDWHRAQADDYLQQLEGQEAAALAAKSSGAESEWPKYYGGDVVDGYVWRMDSETSGKAYLLNGGPIVETAFTDTELNDGITPRLTREQALKLTGGAL